MTAGPDAPDLLRAIVAAAKRTVEHRRQTTSFAALERKAREVSPRADAFAQALARPGRYNVIAECKWRSPARGVLRADYDPAAMARGYAEAGAAAVSVLTEPSFFDGAPEHLRDVRAAIDLPILRKDFVVHEYQLVEARAWGASAALLIVAALDGPALRDLVAAAARYELAALVEVHDQRELGAALDAGARIVGVNNRNLRTLAVSTDTAHALVAQIPGDCLAVAESGLRSGGDLRTLRSAGYHAFLVGERLMTAADPGAALRDLIADAQRDAAGGEPLAEEGAAWRERAEHVAQRGPR